MHSFFRKAILFFICLLAFLSGGSEAGAAFNANFPFQAGERLVYRAKWGFIPAGLVEMAVISSRSERGEDLLHFTMSARTNSRIDSIYPIRDMQNSYTDPDLTRTLYYEKRSSGRTVRDSKIIFDWKGLTATYTTTGSAEKTIAILPGTLDPLALIYAVRLKELKAGAVLEIPVTNGKGFNTVRAEVIGRETITINGKSYDTFVVVAETDSLKGLMEKRPGLKIWYSAGKERIPIKLQSRHAFGNLSFELLSMMD